MPGIAFFFALTVEPFFQLNTTHQARILATDLVFSVEIAEPLQGAQFEIPSFLLGFQKGYAKMGKTLVASMQRRSRSPAAGNRVGFIVED